MKEIKLTKNKVALVDDADYECLNQVKWYAFKTGNTYYAARRFNKKVLLMHRVIMNAETGLEVDHKDHYGLNNQRSNLRICTRKQNRQNQTPFGKSKYLGVSIKGKYIQAAINVNGKRLHLGYFKTEEEAAIAFDVAAKKYRGDFAYQNFNNQ